jgi:hypothetical protein
MYMEDVRDIAVDVDNMIARRLSGFGIELTNEQEDEIHNKVWEVLERVSNGDYRSHM